MIKNMKIINYKKFNKKNLQQENKKKIKTHNFAIIWRSQSFKLLQSKVYAWYGNRKFNNSQLLFIKVKSHAIHQQIIGVNIHKCQLTRLTFTHTLNLSLNFLRSNINGAVYVKCRRKQDCVVLTF